MLKRLENVRKKLHDLTLGAFFISDQHNVTYLTGFSGLSPHEREGYILLTKTDCYLLTFPTYFGLYQQGGDGFQTLPITKDKNLFQIVGEICAMSKIKRLGFEAENLTVAELASLKEKVPLDFCETHALLENMR